MSERLLSKGLVSIYTGSGRGKTTAALGLAMRVLGWGGRVCVIQFIKGYSDIGELKFAEQFSDRFELRQFAADDSLSISEHKLSGRRQAAESALDYAQAIIIRGDYDLVILDEINNALHYELISLTRVVETIQTKPTHVELVLTGRQAPPELIEIADYVTEMSLIKHPFDKGVTARRGIDY